jgi:hypothetical protein
VGTAAEIFGLVIKLVVNFEKFGQPSDSLSAELPLKCRNLITVSSPSTGGVTGKKRVYTVVVTVIRAWCSFL